LLAHGLSLLPQLQIHPWGESMLKYIEKKRKNSLKDEVKKGLFFTQVEESRLKII
jgi:hypothetical protein